MRARRGIDHCVISVLKNVFIFIGERTVNKSNELYSLASLKMAVACVPTSASNWPVKDPSCASQEEKKERKEDEGTRE